MSFSLTHCSSLWDLFKSDLSSPAIFTHSGKNLLVYCKMFSLGISVAVNIHCSCVFISVMEKCMWLTCVRACVCDRTRGMHVPGELWSAARIRTIATETCILLFLHSWHQVRHTHTHTCSHRVSHTEILPHFKAWVAFRTGSFRPCWVVMGSDSLNCYKPQCGAGVKWHMLLGGGWGMERIRENERERER